MVQINIVNFVTIAIITLLAVALVRFIAKTTGKEAPL